MVVIRKSHCILNKVSQLTNALISGVKEFCERSRRSLVLNQRRALLVGRQLAEHAGRHPLDVLDLIVQQLEQY